MNMTRRISVALVAALTLTTAGCAHFEQGVSSAMPAANAPTGPAEGDFGQLVYLGAQTVAERAGALSKDRPIVVATMVSIDNLDKSSTFGRLASQLVSSRLAQRGYLVKDLTYMRALTVQPSTGEMVLSRDAARMSASVNAQAIVAGTYAVGGREIYLNIRMLRAEDGAILSSADVVVPLDKNTEPMLAAMHAGLGR